MAQEYLSSAATNKETDQQKVFLIYKFANTPQAMVYSYIEQMEDRN